MSKEAVFANENLILKISAGSYLYGTNTEKSDKDYIGICIPPEDYVIGLYNFEQYKYDTKKSNEHRLNNKDDVDYTIYSLKKFRTNSFFMNLLSNEESAGKEPSATDHWRVKI